MSKVSRRPRFQIMFQVTNDVVGDIAAPLTGEAHSIWVLQEGTVDIEFITAWMNNNKVAPPSAKDNLFSRLYTSIVKYIMS